MCSFFSTSFSISNQSGTTSSASKHTLSISSHWGGFRPDIWIAFSSEPGIVEIWGCCYLLCFLFHLFFFASYNKRNTQQCTTARQTAPGQGFWIPTLLSSLFSGIKRLPHTIPQTQRDARSAITSTRFKIQHTPWTWFLLAFSHLRTYDLDDGYTHHTMKIWGDDHHYERRRAYGLKLRLTTISTWNGQTNLFVWRIVLRRQLRSPDWTPRGR
jgi:hypothetical protein